MPGGSGSPGVHRALEWGSAAESSARRCDVFYSKYSGRGLREFYASVNFWVDIFSDAVGSEKIVRCYVMVLRFQAAYDTVVNKELLYGRMCQDVLDAAYEVR